MRKVINPQFKTLENPGRWLWIYLVMAFGVSTMAYYANQWLNVNPTFSEALKYLVKFGPSIAGVTVIGLAFGRKGSRELIQRLISFRVPIKYYLLAVLGPLVAALIAVGVLAFTRPISLADMSFPYFLEAFALLILRFFFIGGGLGEELGWRGFMLPFLSEKMSPVKASVWVGIAHGLWHLPAYGLATFALTPMSIAMSVVMSFIFFRTSGNLFLMVLIHASVNASILFVGQLFPEVNGTVSIVVITMLVWIAAALLIGLKWNKQLNDKTHD